MSDKQVMKKKKQNQKKKQVRIKLDRTTTDDNGVYGACDVENTYGVQEVTSFELDLSTCEHILDDYHMRVNPVYNTETITQTSQKRNFAPYFKFQNVNMNQ
jgi:hypothetical protein